MTTIIAMFTTAVVLLGIAHPVPAQAQGRAAGVLDILSEVFGGKREVRGYVIQHREATLVLRAEDGRVYTINTAALDTAALGRLTEGHPVAVSLKSDVPDTSSMPIAAAIQPISGQPAKVFRRVEGTVEAVNGDRITFRTRDGMTVMLDRARIVGDAPRVAAHDTATLVYEEEPRLAGVWIDAHDTVQPSASVGTGAYERVHGFVQSLGIGSLTLKADDGRIVTVDTTQVADQARVRPGDVVSVVGKPAGDGARDRLVAEVIEPDGAPVTPPRR